MSLEVLAMTWGVIMTVAVLVLFAMLAEVWARQPSDSPVTAQAQVDGAQPLPGFVERTIEKWPQIENVTPSDAVLVLSTSCVACNGLASDWKFIPPGLAKRIGVAVVAPSEDAARQKSAEWLLDAAAFEYVDVAGRWVGEEFGISSSPVLVHVSNQRATRAVIIEHVSQLMYEMRELANESDPTASNA